MIKKDELVWKDMNLGNYTIKSSYKILSNFQMEEEFEVYIKLWKSKALPSATVFCWRVFQDKIAAIRNLLHKNIRIQKLNCVMCDRELENSDNLFFRCLKVVKI